MKEDTSNSVGIRLVEQGMRTLTHDWRNILNGINLRITSACYAEKPQDCLDDLEDAKKLITSATGELTRLSRRLEEPNLLQISYPVMEFFEDLGCSLSKKLAENGTRLLWKTASMEGAVEVDFEMLSQALAELLDNTFGKLKQDEKVTICSRAEDGRLVISWTEFYQGAPPTDEWGRVPFFTTERGHLGLGLYFAKRIIHRLQGSLSFDYSPEEAQLQTVVRLPLLSL